MLTRFALPLALLALVPASASAAGWLTSSPVPLSSGESYGSKIAIDDSGRGTATWTEKSNGTDQIMLARYHHGSGWGDAQHLSGSNGFGVDLAGSPRGDEVIAYREGSPASAELEVSTYDSTDDYYPHAFGISATPGPSVPVVAALDDGTLLVAWVDGTNARVAVRKPGSTSFGTTTLAGLGAVSSVRLAAGAGGIGALAITDTLNGESRLMLSMVSPGGVVEAAKPLTSIDASGGATLTDIGLGFSPDGKLGIGFTRTQGALDAELWSLIRDTAGTTGIPAAVDASHPSSISDIHVTFAADGTEAMSYRTQQSGPAEGHLALAPPGGKWTPVALPAATTANGVVRVAPLGAKLLELNGSYGDGFDSGFLPDVASLGTAGPGALGVVDYADAIATHGDDAVATVTHGVNGEDRVEALTWDGTPPVISDLTVPVTATVGAAAAFHVSATDALSRVSVTWDFGDGARATGADVTHTFGAAGTYAVTATATDGAGNKTARSAQIAVSAQPQPPPAASLRFLSAKLNRHHTRLRWSLNLPAKVAATIKCGKRTVIVTRHPSGTSGTARIARAHGRRLQRGRYRIVLRARDASGRSATRTVKLRVR